jgi:hypothetical protein
MHKPADARTGSRYDAAMLARALLALVIIGLPGLVLAPVWPLAGLGAAEDDLLYYFPSRALFASFVERGWWPWLNPLVGMDRPLLADPQSAVFYPFTWLFAWLQTPTAYAASLWAHYSLAIWGMHRFMRSRGCARAAAVFAAVAFAFSGFMLAHRAHFTMVQSAAWLPLVVWRLSRLVERGGASRFVWAVIACAMQCYAGHVQIAALTALGSLVFLLAGHWRAATAGRWLATWLAAGGLFAAQALPTWMYVGQCARTERGIVDFVENTWSPVSAVGWVLPMLLGQRTPNLFSDPYWGPSHQVEQFAYPGVLTLLLAWLAWREARRRAARPWLALLALSLLVATSIVAPVLFLAPGANLLRVPARAMLLFNFALAGLAGQSLSMLAEPLSPSAARCRAAAIRLSQTPFRGAIVWVVACAAPFAVAWVFAPPDLRHAIGQALRPWNPALWIPLVTLAAALASLRWTALAWRHPGRLWLLPALLALDLGIIGWTIDVPAGVRSVDELLASNARAAWTARITPGTGRVWIVTSRSDGQPGEYVRSIDRGVANTNILDGYATLTDYGPLQPRGFARRFGFEPWGEHKRPEALLSDTAWMARCGVGWVLLCNRGLPAPVGCVQVTAVDDMRLFRNPDVRGATYLADGSLPNAIRDETHSPYQFTTTVDFAELGARQTPSTRLVAARLALPGWTASVNGHHTSTVAHDDLLLAVDVPAQGLLRVEWRYFPPGLTIGLITTAVTGLVLLMLLGRAWFGGSRDRARLPHGPDQPERTSAAGV